MEKLEHFRHILRFEFNRGAKSARNICAVYGDNSIGESKARKLFSRFKETPRSGRLSGFDEDRLCTRELANVMNCDHSTIVRHFHSMGSVQKSGVWVLHALSQNHRNQRVAVCASLLALNRLAREQHQQ